MTTITVGDAATKGEKELKTKYPVEEGLTAGTTKQEGTISNLVAEDSTKLIRDRERIGL